MSSLNTIILVDLFLFGDAFEKIQVFSGGQNRRLFC